MEDPLADATQSSVSYARIKSNAGANRAPGREPWNAHTVGERHAGIRPPGGSPSSVVENGQADKHQHDRRPGLDQRTQWLDPHFRG